MCRKSRFDRLNEHYRHVVGLSRLILRHSAFESHRGKVRATGFLMDMNVALPRVRDRRPPRGRFGASELTCFALRSNVDGKSPD